MWKFLSQQIGKLQTRKRPRENDEVEESSSPSPSRLSPSVEPAPPSPVDRGNKRRKLATSSHESIIDEPAVDVPLSRSSSSRRRRAAKAPKSPTPDEEESAGHTETTPNIGRKIKDESDSEEPSLPKVDEPHVTPGAKARGGGRKRKLAEAVESPVEEKPTIEATPRTTKRQTRTPAKYLDDRELSVETSASTTKRSRKPATRLVSEPMDDGPPEATTPETRTERRRYMDRQRQRRHREKKKLKAQEALEAQRVKQERGAGEADEAKDERKRTLAKERQRKHRQSQKEKQKPNAGGKKIKNEEDLMEED